MKIRAVGFLVGIFSFILILILPPFSSFFTEAQKIITQTNLPLSPQQLVETMHVTFALLILMVIWWLTEAVSLSVTALLPAIILPCFHLTGIHNNAIIEFTFKNILLNYSHPIIFLFLGGFFLASAMQKWKLDYRFTLWFLTRANLANDSRKILLAIMSVTAFLSMWISNTATAAMMLPLGLGILSILGRKPGESRFGTALMLSIAWSASIGGVGTMIGSPPNGITIGILNTAFFDDKNFQPLTFLDWMKFGIPYVILFIPLAWFLLLKIFPPEITSIEGGKKKLLEEQSTLGKLSNPEKKVIAVFFLAVLLWITNPFWENIFSHDIAKKNSWIDEYTIGLFAGVLMFLIPVKLREAKFLLEWKDTKSIEWGTLILFGGGIALSDVLFKSGLASWFGALFIEVVGTPSVWEMVVAILFLVTILSEVASNTATVSLLVPIIISLANITQENVVTFSIIAALTASLSFAFPVGTPPNALVYSTGYVRMKDMIKGGLWLDIIGWIFTVGIIIVFGVWIFGVLSL